MDIATALAISAREFELQEERLRSMAAELAAHTASAARPTRSAAGARPGCPAGVSRARLAANGKVLAQVRGLLVRTVDLLR